MVPEQPHRERHDRDQPRGTAGAPEDPVVDAGNDAEDSEKARTRPASTGPPHCATCWSRFRCRRSGRLARCRSRHAPSECHSPATDVAASLGAPAATPRRSGRGELSSVGVSSVAGLSIRWGGGQATIGTPAESPAAVMHGPVVGPAQQQQVGQVGGVAVQPVPPVVGLAPGKGSRAVGEDTAAVAHGQGAGLGRADDPGGPAQRQGLAGRPTQDPGGAGRPRFGAGPPTPRPPGHPERRCRPGPRWGGEGRWAGG